MTRFSSALLLGVVHVLFCLSLAAEPALAATTPWQNFVAAVDRHRRDLEIILSQSQFSSDRRAPQVRQLPLLDLPPNKDADFVGVNKLLSRLIAASMTTAGDQLPPIYIEEEGIIECLVLALHLPDQSVQERALDYLIEEVRPARLKQYDVTIAKAGAGVKDSNVWLLLARVGTPECTKAVEEYIRNAPSPKAIGIVLPARMGDREKEQELLDTFKKEQDVKTKGRLARYLAEVGTDASIRAIAQELRSPVKRTVHSEVISLRYYLLLALRRAFPDEPLFNEELEKVSRATYDKEGDKAEVASNGYFDRVEEWAAKTCGITTWDQPRPPFLLKRFKLPPVEPGGR